MFDNHAKNKIGITFIGCEAQLSFGIVGKENNRIISFERDIDFSSVKKKNNKKFIGYVNSGISIINTSLLKSKFKNCINFEKGFYPEIIQKYKSNLESINGFWHSIDNMKDINILNKKVNLKKYRVIKKIQKKIKTYS